MTDFALSIRYGDLMLTDWPYSVIIDSRDMGAAENVYSVVDLVGDGAIVSAPRRGNREIRLRVCVEGSDTMQRAEHMAALLAEADRARNEIELRQVDGVSPASVYDTWKADLVEPVDDYAERAGLRFVDLVIPADPHCRSVEPVTVEAIPDDPEDVTADDLSPVMWTIGAETGVGWPTGGIPINGTGYVRVNDATPVPTAGWTHLKIAFTGAIAPLVSPAAYVAPAVAPVLVAYTGGGGVAWYAIPSTVSLVTVLEVIYWLGPGGWAGPPATLTAAALTDGMGIASKVVDVAFDMPGTAVTSGRARIFDADSLPLGSVLAVSIPAGASAVALSHHQASGGTATADATAVSGTSQPLHGTGTPPSNTVPIFTITEDFAQGTYDIYVRAKRSSAGTVTITWGTGASIFGSKPVALTTSWEWYAVGDVRLPAPAIQPGSGGSVPFALGTYDGTGSSLDEVLLVHRDCAVTWVEAGAAEEVVIETPSASAPTGEVWVDGLAGDVRSKGMVQLQPGVTMVKLIASGAARPSMQATAFPRHLGQATL